MKAAVQRPPQVDPGGQAVPVTPVRLSSGNPQPPEAAALLTAVATAAGDVPALLELAKEAGSTWPQPGGGSTQVLWELLASVSAIDVAAGRIFEPHLDALAILAQAGHDPALAEGAWGVYAAEGQGLRLEASGGTSGALLSGSKPWCSLAPVLDHAVITANTDGGRRAFAVDLHHAGVTFGEPPWVARGLREIPSGTVHFDDVPAEPLAGVDWYFSRPGFAWGGMGVAACWLGGAIGVGRDYRNSLQEGAASGREPDQVALAALGEIDRTLSAGLQYLARTAEAIDAGRTAAGERGPGWSDALRVRGTVAAAVERVLHLVGSNRGPAPLAFDETYAKRMADLALYVRQHHAMRDDAQLGRLTLDGGSAW